MPDETQMEHEHKAPSMTRERARIYVTGDCDGLPDLREALGAHPEVELSARRARWPRPPRP